MARNSFQKLIDLLILYIKHKNMFEIRYMEKPSLETHSDVVDAELLLVYFYRHKTGRIMISDVYLNGKTYDFNSVLKNLKL